MKLLVKVIEGRNLRAMDFNGSSDPYVRVQLGRHKFRTKVVKKNLNPFWGEDFCFRVDDLNEDLIITVLDEDKYFNDDLVGLVKISVNQVFDAHNQTLSSTWFTLHPKNNKKSKQLKDCGEVLLSVSLSQNNSFLEESNGEYTPLMESNEDLTSESSVISSNSPSRSSFAIETEENAAKEDKSSAKAIIHRFLKSGETSSTATSSGAVWDLPQTPNSEVRENMFEDQSSSTSFDEAMRTIELKDQGEEIPSNLPGGILVDKSYMVTPSDLNSLLFSPESSFTISLAEYQGTTELQQGPWTFENGGGRFKRVVSYLKAATKLIKAVKATEEQTYIKADGKNFAVLVSVSTPDVIYGNTFKVELLYCVSPGPELPTGEQSSRLVISWRMNFIQSTMMKGMIEGGARQGLKSSFEQFEVVLAQNVKPVDLKELGSDKEQALASLQVEPQSDWKLATQYLLNFTVVSTIVVGLYVLLHILLTMPSTIQGLEFNGLDLPDSIGEVIVCGILVLQGERALGIIMRFMQARKQKGTDHGVKARGDGWLLTVALIEGSSLAAVDATGFSDPYVVFSCNGKTKTSSIKFQKSDPQWNEIFEFDAMDDPPSVLDIEVFDFDGPFDEAISLGHAEINFLKSNLSELADIWIPLQGKLAQACRSKLHLRIFLNNTRGNNIVKDYLAKMEKEVGKKINVRSPQTNSTFQKLFGLPPEEFLINDFTCHLKRKLPLQGRLFLSPRIIGFHTNMFGNVTKFFFLWEDIEDIHVLPPTLASMGSPSVIIVLRPGRGMDARHGAKTQDEEGRLKFHFQSFVSFNVGHRTIMALWKARLLTPEQKVQIVEEESEEKNLQTEESGTFIRLEDAPMSEVYSSLLPMPTNFFMELFNGDDTERKVMEKVGCVDYSHTPWELVKSDMYQRQICFKFDKHILRYGGEVTSTQQKYTSSNSNGWVVEEVMNLHGVPFGDYFTLQIRHQVERVPSRSKSCNVQIYLGITWLKNTRHEKRITKNVLLNLTDRLKERGSSTSEQEQVTTTTASADVTCTNNKVTQIGQGLSTWQPPDWAIEPRPGVYYLDVIKDAEFLHQIHLDKRRHIFGRQFPTCDFVLDHQSVSRQHAAVVHHKNGSIYVIDMGSVHGTFVANERLSKESPVELEVGQSLRFAASTRSYILRKNSAALSPLPPLLAEVNLPPPPDPSDEEAVLAYNTILNRYGINKSDIASISGSGVGNSSRGSTHSEPSVRPTKRLRKLRVSFRDQAGGELIEVVGISDGADVSTEPGPLGVKEGSLVGKYESLVQTTVIPKGKETVSMREERMSSKGVTDKLQQVMNKVKGASKIGGMYDDLYGESVISSKVGSSWAYASGGDVQVGPGPKALEDKSPVVVASGISSDTGLGYDNDDLFGDS
ncbi:C2 and gram domain-containing protein [Thalictrum thalictroides]|uniref:C2 and gram domain-containing protein n=1 Tax=Thalictrum thalictroides TaxID=46969 RepID=A0A7J6W2J4_THATH|nr:C2 and gram domain-containing protein [Thalictrum thalictroides]